MPKNPETATDTTRLAVAASTYHHRIYPPSVVRKASTSELIRALVTLGVIVPRTDRVTFGMRRSADDEDDVEEICRELDRRIPVPQISARGKTKR